MNNQSGYISQITPFHYNTIDNQNNENSNTYDDQQKHDKQELIETAHMMTIGEMLHHIQRIKYEYQQNIDAALYYLHLYTHIPEVEVIDSAAFRLINVTVQETCDYIIKHYYPYCDDACELFTIQAQSWARYGTWYDYPQIFKFCEFATKCTPNPIQQTRIERLENIAYNHKFKSQTESTIWHVFKTWFCYNAFLQVMDTLIPLTRREEEYWQRIRLQAGYMLDPYTGLPVRNLSGYLDKTQLPWELLTREERQRLKQVREQEKLAPIAHGPEVNRRWMDHTMM